MVKVGWDSTGESVELDGAVTLVIASTKKNCPSILIFWWDTLNHPYCETTMSWAWIQETCYLKYSMHYKKNARTTNYMIAYVIRGNSTLLLSLWWYVAITSSILLSIEVITSTSVAYHLHSIIMALLYHNICKSHNICPCNIMAQYLPLLWSTYTTVSIKITGPHQYSYTIKCWKSLRLMFSSDLKKQCLITGKSLSPTK